MNVICIDVGSPKNVGWANDRGQTGSALNLLDELHRAGRLLLAGERVALGFEAPIWTPRRAELQRITASRGGVEKSLGRTWRRTRADAVVFRDGARNEREHSCNDRSGRVRLGRGASVHLGGVCLRRCQGSASP